MQQIKIRQESPGAFEWRPTFARLVMNTDGLRLIVSVIVLHTHEVRVRPLIKARSHCQHVLVGLIHSLH